MKLQPALVEEDDAISYSAGIVQDMTGHQNDPVRRRFANKVEHPSALLRVQPDGRLVQQQDRRVVYQRRGKSEAPAHAAGQGTHTITLPVLQVLVTDVGEPVHPRRAVRVFGIAKVAVGGDHPDLPVKVSTALELDNRESLIRSTSSQLPFKPHECLRAKAR